MLCSPRAVAFLPQLVFINGMVSWNRIKLVHEPYGSVEGLSTLVQIVVSSVCDPVQKNKFLPMYIHP